MALTNDAVTNFMERYFETFDRYAQDPDNMHQMSEYFDADLEFKQYYPDTPHIHGLENFHKLNVHPEVREILKPELFIIDTERKLASVLINVEVVDTSTGEIILTPTYNAIYHFKEYEDSSFKISKVWLFVEHSPEYERFLATLPKG